MNNFFQMNNFSNEQIFFYISNKTVISVFVTVDLHKEFSCHSYLIWWTFWKGLRRVRSDMKLLT